MNNLFFVVFVLSSVLLLFSSPECFLPSMLSAVQSSASVCTAVLASYAVWSGLIGVWEQSGFAKKIAKLIKKPLGALLHVQDEASLQAVSMNLSVNLLGLGSAGTPYGITAVNCLDKTSNAEYASAVLFCLNASSVQLIPTTVVTMRASMGSIAPSVVIFPVFLVNLFGAFFSVLMVRFLIPPTDKLGASRLRKHKKARGQGSVVVGV